MAHAVRKLTCHVCAYVVTPQTPLNEIGEGDFTVCPQCGMIWIYEADLSFRWPTLNDMDALDYDMARELAERQQEIFQQVIEERGDEILHHFQQAQRRHWMN